jgi:hypothetical protein
VRFVNAEHVRNHYDSDFSQGGNWARYSFIPRPEIWVDASLSLKESKEVILHEYLESQKMKRGESYSQAHTEAKKVEDAVRHHGKAAPSSVERTSVPSTERTPSMNKEALLYTLTCALLEKQASTPLDRAGKNMAWSHAKLTSLALLGAAGAHGLHKLIRKHRSPSKKNHEKQAISTEQRKELPKSEFGVPSKAKTEKQKGESGNYPIDTPARARSALSYGSRFLSPEAYSKLKARVHGRYPEIGQKGKEGK